MQDGTGALEADKSWQDDAGYDTASNAGTETTTSSTAASSTAASSKAAAPPVVIPPAAIPAASLSAPPQPPPSASGPARGDAKAARGDAKAARRPQRRKPRGSVAQLVPARDLSADNRVYSSRLWPSPGRPVSRSTGTLDSDGARAAAGPPPITLQALQFPAPARRPYADSNVDGRMIRPRGRGRGRPLLLGHATALQTAVPLIEETEEADAAHPMSASVGNTAAPPQFSDIFVRSRSADELEARQSAMSASTLSAGSSGSPAPATSAISAALPALPAPPSLPGLPVAPLPDGASAVCINCDDSLWVDLVPIASVMHAAPPSAEAVSTAHGGSGDGGRAKPHGGIAGLYARRGANAGMPSRAGPNTTLTSTSTSHSSVSASTPTVTVTDVCESPLCTFVRVDPPFEGVFVAMETDV